MKLLFQTLYSSVFCLSINCMFAKLAEVIGIALFGVGSFSSAFIALFAMMMFSAPYLIVTLQAENNALKRFQIDFVKKTT